MSDKITELENTVARLSQANENQDNHEDIDNSKVSGEDSPHSKAVPTWDYVKDAMDKTSHPSAKFVNWHL